MSSNNINIYGQQLSPEQIAAKEHREIVGGLWDELGALQFEFMKSQGLQPHHRLLDVGCGALRGGIHFVRYLDKGNYYGLDINASLIEAGHQELAEAGLTDKSAHLLADEQFQLHRFGVTFDYALAMSVFTHLPMNHIIRCLVEMNKVLEPRGRFFATYFKAPHPAHLDTLTHPPGGIVTNYDADPYHYAVSELEWMAKTARLKVTNSTDWQHPRTQRMAIFEHEPAPGQQLLQSLLSLLKR